MFDFTFSHQPEFDGPLPKAVDVVIVGGGITGVMTAWFLTEMGQKVLLCEKGRIACEQSSRNWGWVRQQGRDIGELPIMMEAMNHWQTFAASMDLGFRRNGITYLGRTKAHMDGFENWLSQAKPFGVDSKMLTAAEALDLIPGAQGDIKGAMTTPSDGCAEPWRAVPILARALAQKGAILRENCAVRRLIISAGCISGVATQHGEVRADRVLIAGGAWSSLFLRNHGINIPQLSVKATVSQTEPIDLQGFEAAYDDMEIGLRRRDDGGLTLVPAFWHELSIGPDAFRHLGAYLRTIYHDAKGTRFSLGAPKGYPDAWGTKRRWGRDETSPFENMPVLNPPPDLKKLGEVVDNFGTLFPQEDKIKIKQAWAGMIDLMPDIVPIVDHVQTIPGLTVGTGMSGHGFGIGPGFGRVLADMMSGKPAGHDMSRFRFDRFSCARNSRPLP